MPIVTGEDVKLGRAFALAKRESFDTYALAMLIVELQDELTDLHNWMLDQGWHDCDDVPGGCPVVAMLNKVTL